MTSRQKKKKSGASSTRKRRTKEKGPITYDPSDLSKPFHEGMHLFGKYYDEWRPCNILEVKARSPEDIAEAVRAGGGPRAPGEYDLHSHGYTYYIHYSDWDRRMDEWITRERLSIEHPGSAAAMASASSHTAGGTTTTTTTAGETKTVATDHGGGGAHVDGVDAVDADEAEDGDEESKTAAAAGTAAAAASTTAGAAGATVTGAEGRGKSKGKSKGRGKTMGKSKDHGHGNDHGSGHDAPSGGNSHGHGNFTDADIKAHEAATKVKNIDMIVLGKYIMPTWYYSPFPEEYNKYSTLYFCEFCLSFFGHTADLDRHARKCDLRHPPGNEIYRSQERNVMISVFEVDGCKEITYTQNLCYIAKLFLDHKTLEYDTTPFLFYILCEVDARGCHIVGYFSKEKISAVGYNLACILALPCHQRKGYGNFLISLSYELSKVEEKVGSPEKPISDLGKVSYLSYWSKQMIDVLSKKKPDDEISIQELSIETRILPEDIIEALQHINVLVWNKGRWIFSMTQVEKLVKERDAAAIAKAKT